MIVSAIEHKSVLAPADALRQQGFEVTVLGTDADGIVAAAALREALRPNTALVSIMAANGEIGTIEPIDELAVTCRERGILFHCDATQAVGKVPVDLSALPCDLLSMSAHKIYGPKGVGALIIRSGVRIAPLTIGGGQEKNIRSGTVNVGGAVGLAEALEIRREEMSAEAERLTAIRNHLRDRIVREIPGAAVNGPTERRLPGNLNVSFEDVEAEALIVALRGFSISAGSACSSGDREPSHVLRAIGCDDARALSSIRIGLGKSNTVEEADRLVEDLAAATARLREISVR